MGHRRRGEVVEVTLRASGAEVTSDRQIILPVWHKVSQTDVMGYSPSLAAKLARSTTDRTVNEIAAEIAEVARA